MYKEFFGLRANPFNVNPDPRYLFLTRHTEEALACLTYGIQSRKGFVLLTGEVGTGKTTLINKLLEWLRLQQVATAFIFNSRLNTPQFLDYMMADFGIPCDSKAKSQILLRLYNWLLDRYRAGETAVLIVDEAQNLSDEVLEEIRMLTNLETFTEKLLQIVLVGQPELEHKLKQPQMRQLRQRLTLRARTHPLTLEETKAYVQQRLRIAGSNGQQIFDPDSLVAIFSERPALHRYPGAMAKRVHELCRVLTEQYGGRAEAVWEDAGSGADLLRRVWSLPGFGEQKAKIFVALLGKQLGVRPPGWKEASAPYSETGSFRSAADIVDEPSLRKVRAFKQDMKAAPNKETKVAAKAPKAR